MKKDIYNTIKAPHLTEKVTNLMNQSNQYAFKVNINYIKKEIKKAVEEYLLVCILYTSDAADDLLCVDLGGRSIIEKKKKR